MTANVAKCGATLQIGKVALPVKPYIRHWPIIAAKYENEAEIALCFVCVNCISGVAHRVETPRVYTAVQNCRGIQCRCGTVGRAAKYSIECKANGTCLIDLALTERVQSSQAREPIMG